MIEGKCRMCKSHATIVYQDFYHERSGRPFLQLCLGCLKMYMVEEYNLIINEIPKTAKKECKDCGEVFLVNSKNSWANRCFECWKNSKNFDTRLKQEELKFEATGMKTEEKIVE